MTATASPTIRELVSEAAARARALTPAEVEGHLLARDATIVDVREPAELAEHGWIAEAVHVPRGLLEFRADPDGPLHRPELDPERLTILCSATGRRSALAVATLRWLGYRRLAHLDGGITAWKQAGRPVVGLAGWHRVPVAPVRPAGSLR